MARNAGRETTGKSDRLQGHGALCVDLDGTLLRSDLLYESLLAMVSRNPLLVLLLPFWLLRGKANLKRQIALRGQIPAAALPYDERVLAYLRDTPQRPRVLCTASDLLLVQPISDHLGLFEEVIASDGTCNIAGSAKATALVERFGRHGFDYMGNHAVDLAVWRHAKGAIVVNASARLASQASGTTRLIDHWPPHGGGLRTWAKALRLHQWLKNLLVFVPLVTAHRFLEPSAILGACAAFVAFGLCASGVYLLNDLIDLEPDRQHPRKHKRPFAAGNLPLIHGLMAAPTLALAGIVLAFAVVPAFALLLVVYYAMTLGYSLKLKRIVMIDVVLLASLYTIRIIGGAVAIVSPLSFWLLAFSMFIFLSLALLKRYTELAAVASAGKRGASGRAYSVADLLLIQSLGTASGYIGVLVFALYINSPNSLELYVQPQMLWLLCPVLLYWISRTWVIAHRGCMHDDPILFAVRDRVSQCTGVFALLIVLAATHPWY